MVLTISLLPAISAMAGTTLSGSGTFADPYLVATDDDLNSVCDDLTVYYKQTADITINTTTYPSWSPIGTAASPFTGNYDGDGYKISGLKIDTTAHSSANTILGLFGVVGDGAVLNDIALEGVDIDVAAGSSTYESFIGSLAGVNYGTITDCSVVGNIDAASYNIEIGGLVGNNGSGGPADDGDISGCTSDCTINVTVNYQQGHVGGLVGSSYATGSSIINCTSTGTVTGVGGSVVNQTSVFSGGLIGYASDTTITGCSSDAVVSATNVRSQAQAGGLIGGIVASCLISNCSSTGDAIAGDAVGSTGTTICAGGLIGKSFSSSVITNSFSTGDATATGTGASTSSGTYTYVYSGGFLGYISAGSSALNISQCYSTGFSSATVSTYGYAFAGGFGGYYMQADVSKSYSKGNAHAVSTAGYASAGGFTGYLFGADASTSPSTLTNCFSTGNASADCVSNERVGGLSGVVQNSIVSYCYSTGIPSVVHDTFLPKCGGLTGAHSGGTIGNCYYDSTVSGKTDTDKGTPMATSDMKKTSFITSLTNVGADWKLVSNLNSGYPIIGGVGLGALPMCTVTYKDSTNTSTVYGMDTVAQDIVFLLPASINPTKSGKTLSGWYTDSSCGSTDKWDFITDKATTGILTLYADWDSVATNTAPTFVGSTTALVVNENSSSNNVKVLLHASDTDSSQTLTWTQYVAPGYGTLTITGATASTGSSDITPGGTITYTPNAGYYGSDSFTIQVSDGTDASTRAVIVTVTPIPALTGTVSITGAAVFGETLTASLSGSNNTGMLSYQWVRGSTDIPSATGSIYTLGQADIGQQIKVRITSSVETGTITSASASAVQKANAASTVSPVLSSKMRTSVTLTSVVGYEYIRVSNGADISTGTWQDSNVFSGLTSGTAYDFYQRIKETATHKASGVSDKLDVTTNVSSASTPTPTPAPTSTPTPIATPTATPAPTTTPAAAATPTPAPTATGTPTTTPEANSRTITGTLLDSDGNPMAGYVVELHSDPITTVTDANGRYTFYDVDYTSHELIVKTAEGEKIAEFELAFVEGEEFGTDMSEKGVNITYTRSTETVNIEVELIPDQGGAAISQVSGSDNPQTGGSLGGIGTVLLWIGGGVLALMLIALMIIILKKKKKKKVERKELI